MIPSSRSRRGGFTIIELLISVTIIGILASVAIPAFTIYMRKARTTEMYEALDKMCSGAKVYFANHADFPPSTGWGPVMTHEDRCATGSNVFPAESLNDFNSREWTHLMFRPGSNSRYRFQWQYESMPAADPIFLQGLGWAVGDLDCDGVKSIFKIHLRKIGGSPMTRVGAFLIFGEETE